MAHRHPTDPAVAWAVAEKGAVLVAQGLIEAGDLHGSIVAATLQGKHPVGDLMGFELRLHWHIRDLVEDWERRRDRCWWDLRRHIAPMIERRDASADILDAAYAFNDAAGSPFLRAEAKEIVAEELRAALRVLTRGQRRVR